MANRVVTAACLGALLGESLAFAAPKLVNREGATPRSADEQSAQKKMSAELRRGRQLVDKGKRTEAFAAFEAALAAVPGEPRVLSELCVALRAGGELVRAEEVCNKAVEQAKEAPLRAASLYNLGRLLEQKGDKPGAIGALRSSLKLRENRIVREKLLDLDPSTQSDALQPEPLAGPFPNIAAWCSKQSTPCQLGKDAAVKETVDQAPAPWKSVQLFTIGESPTECVLALQTASGWFFGRPTYCRDGEFRQTPTATFAFQEVLAPPGPKLLLTLRGTDSMRDYDEEQGRSVCCLEAEFTELVVCGIGASQTPHCTRAISLQPALDAPKNATEVRLTTRFSGNELVLLRADGKPITTTKPRLAPTLQAIAGRHRMVFP